ncbi:hypothetical protein KAFR_0K00930 [Kazachstania africana CBS 2517]|uniref:Pseudouridine synthase n=1 Tax=Kazachstania africana (strain ATCC 22294 / BCRC 22015 / CBS 2517 / CECT 1963 / NBRC 1671 / NRRL Y-8276) TaxID=1071382 RepID=H2B1E9_KAZAF|nr:hypothetical protein KAFR_0K00930 [Kazachstania africana CBS 2517]CCF60449.1 hypothetical protein KAFR_0K00930 [Kazachstania africana CBS 2517]
MGIEVCFSSGLRHITPYYATRSSFAKGRWFNKSLLEVLSAEFGTFTRDQYLKEFDLGNYQLLRNSERMDPVNTLIRSGDIIVVRQHKHEPPVKQWCLNRQIENFDLLNRVAGMNIVFEDDDLLVLDKPNGLPIHPTGKFYHNTLIEILKSHNKNVFPTYRLDKVTSGLIILAKSSGVAKMIQDKIKTRNVTKLYLARVKGKFPGTEPVKMDSPIYTIDPKRRFPAGLTTSRDATTEFSLFKYLPDVNESVVLCRPLTGRTHQIRIHLLRLGYPIVNDPLYCPEKSSFPLRLRFIRNILKWEDSVEPVPQIFDAIINEYEDVRLKKSQNLEKCSECGSFEIKDSPIEELVIWLHAWKYSIDEASTFETDLPTWAC